MYIHSLLDECHGSEIINRLGSFKKQKEKEAIDSLDRTYCDSLFQSETVLGKKISKLGQCK